MSNEWIFLLPFSLNVLEENVSHNHLFLFSFWQPLSDGLHHLRPSWGSDESLEWGRVLLKGFANLIFTAKGDSFIQATKSPCGPTVCWALRCRGYGVREKDVVSNRQ